MMTRWLAESTQQGPPATRTTEAWRRRPVAGQKVLGTLNHYQYSMFVSESACLVKGRQPLRPSGTVTASLSGAGPGAAAGPRPHPTATGLDVPWGLGSESEAATARVPDRSSGVQ